VVVSLRRSPLGVRGYITGMSKVLTVHH